MIKKIKNVFNQKMPEGGFRRNVAILMSGSSISQAIPVIASPILTRFYSPEDFGTFALYLSLSSFFSTISTGRYEHAIVLPKKESNAINLLGITIIFSLFFSLFIFFLFFVFNNQITIMLGNPKISSWLYFIPLFVSIMSLYNTFFYWDVRNKLYGKIFYSKISNSFVTAIINIKMGLINMGTSGLVLGNIFGHFVATIVLVKSSFLNLKTMFNSLSMIKMKQMMFKYKNFPLKTVPSAIVNSLYNNGKFFIFALFLLPEVMGFLYLTYRVLMMPVTIISSNMANVLFQESSILINSANMKDTYIKMKKVFFTLIIAALPITVAIYFLGEFFFSFFFGSKWAVAGKYASLLCLAFFAQFCCSPFCKIFYVINKQGTYLIWEVFRFILVFLPFSILGLSGYSVNTMIFSLSLTISLSYFVLIFLLRFELLKRI